MNKKIFSRFTAIIIVAIILISVLPSGFALDNHRYGYRHLDNDAQRIAYNAFVAGVGKLDNRISFTAPGMTFDDIDKTIRVVISDYPEFFWFNGDGSISYDNNGNYIFTTSGYVIDGKTVNADSVAAYKAELESAAASAIAGMPNGSDYDKALYLHDYIALAVDYVSDDHKDDQTVYGALVEGKAVCAGYARTYQYLLRMAGIESWYVTGISEGQGHGWNLVYLDGKCYYTDVTWDDNESGTRHTYFMLSLEQMSSTHTVDDMDAAMLPNNCNHNDMSYFAVKGGNGTGIGIYTQGVNAKDIAGWCKQVSDGKFFCLLQDNTGLFHQWLDQNLTLICNELGLTGELSYECQNIDNEYAVTISGTPVQKHTHDMPLTKVPAKRPSCTVGGNIEYYTCSGCQALFADKDGTDEITAPDSVKLSPTGHNYSNLKSSSTEHWKECACGAVESGTRAAHVDSNKDNKCDTCNTKLQSAAQEQPTTEPMADPSSQATDETILPTQTDSTERPAQDPTLPSTETLPEDVTEEASGSASSDTSETVINSDETNDDTNLPSVSTNELQTSADSNDLGAKNEQNDNPSVVGVVIGVSIVLAVGGALITIILTIRKKKS